MKTITLNGINWDAENLKVNGETHFTYEEAQREAYKLGKRLPTKREFEELLELPHVWDTNRRGMWFSENISDLKSDQSLFLPADGNCYDDGVLLNNVGEYGYYWSATPRGINNTFILFFGYICDIGYNTNSYGYCVRCVSK